MYFMVRHAPAAGVVLSLLGAQGGAQPTARVFGRFVDSLSGEPIPVGTVKLAPNGVRLDSTGKFSFERLTAGRYDLSFSVICWRPHKVVIEVTPGAPVNLFDIALSRSNCEGPNSRTGAWEYPARPTCEIRSVAPTDTMIGRRVRVTRDSAQMRWHVCTGFDGLRGVREGR
jgi:hypothetical protein